MDRASAAADAVAEFAVLADAASLDVYRTVGRALDAAYAQMGFASTDLPDPMLTPQQGADLPALVDYYVLRSIARNLAVEFDRSDIDQKATYSQMYTHAAAELARAEAIISARGYNLQAVLAIGRLELDFLEPDQGWR